MFQELYNNRIIRADGKIVTRLNKAVKYRIDGSIEWCHIYDEYGNIKEVIKQ
ncbi:MAG TPA: hypothetical protein PLP27_05620 [Crocinitomicaceae bacterium]|nr:hypothetical protein [Crocinitomicaceae bacterium]